jgi:hypothetical protein
LAISASRFRSLSINWATSSRTSSASLRGTIATPSLSPTTISPGITTAPPQLTGTFTSPQPSLSHPPGHTDREKAGKPSVVIASTSRTAPSTMIPPSPFAAAAVAINSPKTALVMLPPVLTTSMSPGSAASIAL